MQFPTTFFAYTYNVITKELEALQIFKQFFSFAATKWRWILNIWTHQFSLSCLSYQTSLLTLLNFIPTMSTTNGTWCVLCKLECFQNRCRKVELFTVYDFCRTASGKGICNLCMNIQIYRRLFWWIWTCYLEKG